MIDLASMGPLHGLANPMKILLDNFVHKHLKRLLPGHAKRHASEVGISRLSNGRLIRAASEAGFDVLITADQKFRHQQDLARLPLPLLDLSTRDTRFPALEAMSPHLEAAIAAAGKHLFITLDYISPNRVATPSRKVMRTQHPLTSPHAPSGTAPLHRPDPWDSMRRRRGWTRSAARRRRRRGGPSSATAPSMSLRFPPRPPLVAPRHDSP